LLGPLVSVGGAGTVDIPAQRLKFRVNPFMLASVEGQSGKNNMLGFPVPIAVSGPWDNPSIFPDIVGVLESPVAGRDRLLAGGVEYVVSFDGSNLELSWMEKHPRDFRLIWGAPNVRGLFRVLRGK
jgi:hypothetical protein